MGKISDDLECIITKWRLQSLRVITHKGQRLSETVVRFGDKYIYCSQLGCNGYGKAINVCIKLNLSFTNIMRMYYTFDGLKKVGDPNYIQSSYYDNDLEEWILNLQAFKNFRIIKINKKGVDLNGI